MNDQPTTSGAATTSRRQFLRKTGAAAVASTLAGTLSIARSAHAAGDDTLKVALVGCGGRGTGAVVQALSTKGPVKLWAMADLFEDKIEKSLAALEKANPGQYDRQAHGSMTDRLDVAPERRFVGFDAYKQAIDSGVDVVILTTQPHFRPLQFEYAVQQGKHVFMEKPVATDVPGIRQVLAAAKLAKEKNLKVGVGFQRHHDASYVEVINRLRDGAVGPVQFLRCYWNSSGARAPFERTPGMGEMEYQLRSAYYFTWISGDHIVEQHVHNLDVCNWIMGDHPVSAQGQGGRQVRVGPLFGDIFDHHCVEYTYADGTKMISQCRHIPGCWNYVGEYAVGLKGQSDVGGGVIEAGGDRWRFRGEKTNPYQVEHDVLFDAIRNDRPHNEAEYGAMTTMTAIMGRMATYSGQVVQWDEAIRSEVSLSPDRYAWDGTPSVLPGPDGFYPCAVPGVTKVL
ncbi:MAG: Gfo/Idh/MocA family oxidoreductase [Patescibacteria group bacterium]|nr:Gfo/Idh/MocA family oxidoreductase [Patescibacteria group bacterium]